MSKTYRKHVAKRRSKTEDDLPKGVRKSQAQKRRTEKQKLRKEWT